MNRMSFLNYEKIKKGDLESLYEVYLQEFRKAYSEECSGFESSECVRYIDIVYSPYDELRCFRCGKEFVFSERKFVIIRLFQDAIQFDDIFCRKCFDSLENKPERVRSLQMIYFVIDFLTVDYLLKNEI